MNWEDSQFAAQAFAKSRGGMPLGEQWSLASALRADGSCAPRSGAENAKKISQVEENAAALACADEKYRRECAEREELAYKNLFNELEINDGEQQAFIRQFIESLGVDVTQL